MTTVIAASQPAGLLTPNGTFVAELIAFILMILILGKYAYPRIIAAATDRENKIEAGLRAAQEARGTNLALTQACNSTMLSARTAK